MNTTHIREALAEARARGLRIRDAAESIGLSEGAALAAHIGAHTATTQAVALRGPWLELLQSLEDCGPLLALTRNATTVHEKTGVYEHLSGEGSMGLALGHDIDLRLFFNHWHAGLAVTERGNGNDPDPLPSLQFFDRHGTAVHKIFARETTHRDVWRRRVAQWSDPHAAPSFEPASHQQTALDAIQGVDAMAFSDAWSGMTDTHQFFPLLRQFGVGRRQAFRLVEGRYTRRMPTTCLREALTEAAFDGTPIMVFVGSPGCIQIHTGPVKRVEPMEMNGQQWLNVLDPGFNLHLREDLIDEAWTVEKPTSDGVVSSLEVFDARGELMAMLFGARKPGQPERPEWRGILSRLSPFETAPFH